MAESIDVAPGVRIPGSAIQVRSVRSSGPGGQNVNKVESKIELTVELSGIEGLDQAALRRLESLAGRRLSAEGRLRVTAQESREKRINLERAREKVRKLLAAALVTPRKRRPTMPSPKDQERRLRAKKRNARIKATRRVDAGEE